jgi:hypothetical protein
MGLSKPKRQGQTILPHTAATRPAGTTDLTFELCRGVFGLNRLYSKRLMMPRSVFRYSKSKTCPRKLAESGLAELVLRDLG